MATKSKSDELFETLRARGLRKRAARVLSDAASAGRSGASSGQKAAEGMVADLRKLADELEDRIRGGSPTKRSEAAKKAARTRERNAAKRSASAKKAAATRKRSSSSGGTRKRASSSSSGGTRKRATKRKS